MSNNKIYYSPDWNERFEPSKRWEHVENIEELKSLIKDTATVFQQNTPKSEKELIAVKQSSGKRLDAILIGSNQRHSDVDLWVTKKTLPCVMRIYYSLHSLKDDIEQALSKDETKELYYKTLNCFRYVYEIGDNQGIFNTSGDDVFGSTVVSVDNEKHKKGNRDARKQFKLQKGYYFVGGDSLMNRTYSAYCPSPILEPTGSINLVSEIIDTLGKCQDGNDKETGNANNDKIHLTADQLDLLNWYNEKSPQICYISSFHKNYVGSREKSPDEKTNRRNAQILREKHLIERPAGKNRGDVITLKGQGYIEKHFQ